MNTEARMMVANAVVKQKEDHLEHHGILGMKWGIRRYQPYGVGYDAKNKGKFVGKIKNERTYKKVGYQNKHIIPKGTKMYRSVVAGNDKQSGDGSTYVTFLPRDRKFYKQYIGARDKGTVKEIEYDLKSDLKIPSQSEYNEVVNKIIEKNKSVEGDAKKRVLDFMMEGDSNSILNKRIPAEYAKTEERIAKIIQGSYPNAKRETMFNDIDEVIDICDEHGIEYEKIADFISFKEKQNAGKWYLNILNSMPANDIVSASLAGNEKVKKEIITELQSRGYNAMVDMAGVGVMRNPHTGQRQNEGDEPLIIFNANETLRKRKVV